MYFRPFPVLTLLTIVLLAVLVWLGQWQLGRAEWKRRLVADYEAIASEQPPDLASAYCGKTREGGVAGGFGQPVDSQSVEASQAKVPSEHRKSLRLFGHASSGQPGWRLFTLGAAPACGQDGGFLLIESGFEPLEGGPATPYPPDANRLLTAWPERPMMAAENAPERNDWHWLDPVAVGRFFGVEDLDQRHIVTIQSGMPDFLTRTPPARHIGYAVTWFGMAVGLAFVYAFFHVKAGRLRFGSQGDRKS